MQNGITLDLKRDPGLYQELMKLPPENRRMSWLQKNMPQLADRAMKISQEGENEALQDVPWYADPTNYSPVSMVGGAGEGLTASAGMSLARKALGAVKGAAKDVGAQGLSLAAMEKAYDKLEKQYPDHPFLDTLASMIVAVGGAHVAGKVMNRFLKRKGVPTSEASSSPSGESLAGAEKASPPLPLSLPESVTSVPPGGFKPEPTSYPPTPGTSTQKEKDDVVELLFREKLGAWKRATGSEKDRALRDLLDFVKTKGVNEDLGKYAKALPKPPSPPLALPESVIKVPPGGFRPPVIRNPYEKYLQDEPVPASPAEAVSPSSTLPAGDTTPTDSEPGTSELPPELVPETTPSSEEAVPPKNEEPAGNPSEPAPVPKTPYEYSIPAVREAWANAYGKPQSVIMNDLDQSIQSYEKTGDPTEYEKSQLYASLVHDLGHERDRTRDDLLKKYLSSPPMSPHAQEALKGLEGKSRDLLTQYKGQDLGSSSPQALATSFLRNLTLFDHTGNPRHLYEAKQDLKRAYGNAEAGQEDKYFMKHLDDLKKKFEEREGALKKEYGIKTPSDLFTPSISKDVPPSEPPPVAPVAETPSSAEATSPPEAETSTAPKKPSKVKKTPVKVTSQEDDRTPQDLGLPSGVEVKLGEEPRASVNARELAKAVKELGGNAEVYFDKENQKAIVNRLSDIIVLPAKVEGSGGFDISTYPKYDNPIPIIERYGKDDVPIDVAHGKIGEDKFDLKAVKGQSPFGVSRVFPKVTLHTFSPAEAKEILSVAKSIDDKANDNSYMSKVWINSNGDNKIDVVGTDGTRLIHKTFPAQNTQPFRITFSGKKLQNLLKTGSPLTISKNEWKDKRYVATSGNRQISEDAISTPNHNDVFLKEDTINFKVPKDVLAHLKEIVGRKISNVDLSYKNGKLTLDGGANSKKEFNIPEAPAGSFKLSYNPKSLLNTLEDMKSPQLHVPVSKDGPASLPTMIKDNESNTRSVVMPFADAKNSHASFQHEGTTDPSATMGFMGSQMLASPDLQKSLSLDKVKNFLHGVKETLGEHFKAPDTKAFQSYITHLGEFERVSAQMDMEARHAMESFDAMPETLQTRIMDDYEHGTLHANTPELQTLVNMGEFRQHLWEMVKGITGVSTDIPNYLAHIYKNPVEAEKLMGAFITRHGGLAGALNYLKKRKISFYDVARDLGLEPLTTNPVRLQSLTIRSLNRFLMAHHFKGELQQRGWALTPMEAQAYGVTGWVPLSDKVMEGLVVPPEVHKIWRQNEINQHLEGMLNPISSLSNKVNAVNLGLSAFHFMTTSLSSMMRKGGLALSEIVNSGTLQGLSKEDRLKMLKEGTKALSFVDAPYKYVKKGALIRQRAKSLGMTTFGDYSEMTSSFPDTVLRALALAGGRLQKPVQYQVAAHSLQESMKTLREGRHLEGVAAIIPAAIEKLSEPLFDRWVPNLKVGMFSHFVETIMRENPGKTLEELTPELQKAWRAVDNSEGEVVYDNLGWSKTARMLAHLSVRSVGWNLGTLSLFKNAAVDYAKAVKGGLTNGEVRFTPDMGYIPMMIAVTGMAGSAIYALQFHRFPDNLTDALMPPQGRVDENGNVQYLYNSDGTLRRWSMPSYLKDVFSYGHDPEQTVLNKLNPLFEMMTEQIQNKNYYGETIAAPSDPLPQRIMERAESALSSSLPFSVTGIMQNYKHGADPMDVAGPLVGFMPAPKYISTSPAEELASKLAEDRMPPMKKSERDLRDLHGQIEQELRSDRKKGLQDLRQAIKDHKVTVETAMRMIKMSQMTPMEYHIRVLPVSDILKVWDEAKSQKALTPERKAQDLQSIRKVLLQRILSNPASLMNYDNNDKEKILQIIRGQEYAGNKAS